MSQTQTRRRFPWWIYWILLMLVLLFALWPVASVATAGLLAEANGCILHEGFTNPCMIGGADQGPTLYALFVMGWFMLATLPLGGGALLVWLVVLIIHRIAWRQAGRRAA